MQNVYMKSEIGTSSYMSNASKYVFSCMQIMHSYAVYSYKYNTYI